MNRQKITTIVLCALFAAITAVLSQIAIPMPSGVPVTLQTFAIALCGFYLCTARATVSTVVYVLLGAVGVPVFSGFKGGIASIVGPTGGFIIGFIAMAAISGIAFRNMPEKFRIPLRIAMGILGVAACHICGFVQYALVAGKDLLSSFLLVSAPYLIKDIASVVLAYFANFENGTYQYTTTVPISQIPVLKNDPNRMNVDFFIGDYSGTYFLQFNVEQSFKPGIGNVSDDPAAWTDWTPAQNAEVRHALGLLIDRNYIVDSITQGGQLPAYGFVPAGMDDGTGTEFRAKAEKWWSVDPADKEANIAEALDILKKYYTFDEATGTFTDFPVFEYSVNPTSGNLAMCPAIQDMWDDYGITVSVDQRDWAVIQTALSNGDFTMSRLGWIADYIDPITFLEIYVAASGNNHPRLGKDGAVGSAAGYGNGSQTWNEAYEQLITTIKTSSDMQARADAMYQAEKALMDTYAVIPIYYYTNPYLAKTNVKDFLYSPLGFVYFRTAYIEG